MHHVTVYREPGRYAGWPANYGIWSWGDEIVVGFVRGYYAESEGMHTRDKSRPFETMLARSLDGGETWSVEPIRCRIPGNRALSADEHVNEGLRISEVLDGPDGPAPSPGGIDFTHPDFALLCARSGLGGGARSWFYVSYDRCRTWEGPYSLPMFGQTGIAARTDYLVNGADDCHLFLTASKPDDSEGRPFCARTRDGGKRFEFLSWIGPEPEGFAIMPASVRLPGGRILVAVRCREGRSAERKASSDLRSWIELYASDDDGASWTYLNTPADELGRSGNPPTLTLLADGRLCLTYGYRFEPYGMRARLSSDGGASWGEEIVLRADGATADLGYSRTVQRPDGKIVTVYYFNDDPQKERFISATIWSPEA